MNSFEFFNPVRIVFGPGSAPKTARWRPLRKEGPRGDDARQRKASGILDRVIRALDEAGAIGCT